MIEKRVLLVGGSWSAEDIALQCWRAGATCAHISHRRPGGFGYSDWPEQIVEKKIIKEIQNETVIFEDGSEGNYDVIIKCTGYLHDFPFLPDYLNPKISGNVLIPENLYKQTIMMSNPSLFFIGMQNNVYTFPMYHLQACLIRDVISGKKKKQNLLCCLFE